MDKIINRNHYFTYSSLLSFQRNTYKNKIFLFIKKVSKEYPGFSKWYNHLFEMDDKLCNEREIIICENFNLIVGIIILKRTKEEQKVCTLRVDERFQHQGIGRCLMEMGFEWLENEKPLITLRESKRKQFESLFLYYGFTLEQSRKNYYRLFNTELVYNGILPEKKILFKKFEFLNPYDVWQKFIEMPKNEIYDFWKWYIDELSKEEPKNTIVYGCK